MKFALRLRTKLIICLWLPLVLSILTDSSPPDKISVRIESSLPARSSLPSPSPVESSLPRAKSSSPPVKLSLTGAQSSLSLVESSLPRAKLSSKKSSKSSLLNNSLIPNICHQERNRRITLNKDADVFISVLLDLSFSAADLKEACESLTDEGVIQFESLRWLLQRINKSFGQIGTRIIQDTFIPGIQMGLLVHDISGHHDRILSYLQKTFPELGNPSCPSKDGNATLPVLGVVDLTGAILGDRQLKSLLDQQGVPTLSLKSENLAASIDRANAVLGSTSYMGWKKVSLVIEVEPLTLRLAQDIASISKSYNVCISDVAKVPTMKMTKGNEAQDVGSVISYKLYSKLLMNDAVIIVATGLETIKQILKTLRNKFKPRKIPFPPIVLTFQPTSHVDPELNQLSDNDLWFVSFFPSKIPEFDARWKTYSDSNHEKVQNNEENTLVLKFLEQKRNCSKLKFDEEETFSLKSSRETYVSHHGVSVMANAIKQAWRVKCRNRKGPCEALMKLKRRELREDFLIPLELSHQGPGSRSPLELVGQKYKGDSEGTLHGMTLGLYKHSGDKNGTSHVAEVLQILPSKIEIISKDIYKKYKLNDKEVNCDAEVMPEDFFEIKESPNRFSVLEKLELKPEKHIFIPSSEELLIAGFFPVHFPSADGADCNATINQESLQEVEAFLWAIDQINKHPKLLPQSKLGALILDTCGSKIRAVNQVTSLVKNSIHGLGVNSSHILSVVTSFEPETARVVGDMLATLNITSINLGTSDAHNPFALQMKPSVNHEAEAMVQILRHIGWDFVTLITSVDDFESNLGGAAFKNIAKASRICIANEVKMTNLDPMKTLPIKNKLLKQLNLSIDEGARGVVTFLTPIHLQLLMETYESGVKNNNFSVGQLTFLGSANWGDQKHKFFRYNDTLGSVLLLEDGQLEVSQFSLYYKLLSPKNNFRNPWFEESWLQHFPCDVNSSCDNASSYANSQMPVIPYSPTPGTPRVIQAVFSFGAALTQLLHHLCPHLQGKLCTGLPMWRQRTVLNEFLRNTEVSRVDNPPEYFQFTDNFRGNTAIEIVNLKRSIGNKLEYKKIGRYVNSRLAMSPAFGNFPNGSSVPLNSISSTCDKNCHFCDDQNSDFVFVDSEQKIFILAIFDIREKGQNLLECGSIRSDQGIQNVESLLWTLRYVNENSPFKLGALIFDTCNSKEKVGRDLTNFMTGRIPDNLKDKIPSFDHIVGIVTGSRGEVISQILDITKQYQTPIIATQGSHSFADTQLYPTLITLAPTNAVFARCLASLATYWKWTRISLVYSDFGDSRDIYQFVLQELQKTNVKLQTIRVAPEKDANVSLMLDIWSGLAEAAEVGSRVVVLLLETPHETLFLQTAKLLEEKELAPGDLIYITSKFLGPFAMKETEVLGSLVIQPMNGHYKEFSEYFKNLTLTNRSFPYPWFQEFWSKIHNCRGASCYNTTETKLTSYPFRQAKGVVETANAVRLIIRRLELTVDQHCKGILNSSCSAFQTISKVSPKLLNLTRKAQFDGVDGQPVLISTGGYNVAAAYQILNYQILDNRRTGLVRVGLFNDMTGLSINGSQLFTYDAVRNPISYKDVLSFDGGHDIVIKNNITTVEESKKEVFVYKNFSMVNKQGGAGFTQMYPSSRFGITIQVPFHRKTADFFSCGNFYSESVFQNLVAVAYALSEMNKKSPSVGIGAIIFDFCERTEKAREQLFRYFSGDLQRNFHDIELTKERIVASINFSDKSAEAVSTILSSNYIPQFTSPVGDWEVKDRKVSAIMSSIPSRSAELRIYISLLKSFKWNYVSVIYDNDDIGQTMVRLFREYARRENVCIGDSLAIPKRVSQEYSQELVETMSLNWKPKVILLLIEDSDNIRTLLEVFNYRNQSENFIFLSGNAWGNKMAVTEDLHRISSGALTITLETYDLPEFRDFFANLSLSHHEPFNKEWFQEYFQFKYKCKLSDSQHPSSIFRNECSGQEKTHPDDILQDPFVFHTILMVNTIVHGLDSYLRKNCANVKTVAECIVNQAELLHQITEFGSIYLNNTQDFNLYDKEGAFGYHIWNFRKIGREYGYVNLGKWENGKLKIEKSNVEFKIGPYAPESLCSSGTCLETCAFQSPVYAVKQMPEPLPMDHNYKTIYGIVTSSLSLLGVITILITLIYFMVRYPTTEGTSILGYFIIIGCLMIYAVNFAFIFQPSIGTCALRRFMMGVAYAIVYSSLLVKVMQSWRLASFDDTEIYANKPVILVLVCVALIMVQVVLGSAWLILYPPQIDLIDNVYRCSPGETFEKDLVVSLIYVMMLNAITLIFCTETWHSSHIIKDTRWVLLAGTFSAFTWLIWTIVATQAPILFRDPAIVIGNLVSATTILLFLYARRTYIYSYLKEEMKDLELRSEITDASYLDHSLSQNKLTDLDNFQHSTTNPLREAVSGGQFGGGQNVSFRTVALPPEDPSMPRSSMKFKKHYQTSKRGRRNFAFESSEDDPDLDVNPFSDDDMSSLEDGTDVTGLNEDSFTSLSSSSRATAILTMPHPSIQRVGTRQMLVFLADGNSCGEVSRI